MEKKYIYNDALDSKQELDPRTLEIIVDCLEACLEAYEDDEDMDAVARIDAVLSFLKA